MSDLSDVRNQMLAAGFVPPKDLRLTKDRKAIRFNKDGTSSSKSAWAFIQSFTFKNKTFYAGAFGSFATNEKYVINTYQNAVELDQQMLSDIKKKVEDAYQQAILDARSRNEKTRDLFNCVWKNKTDVTVHPYLDKKGITLIGDAFIDDNNILYLPMRDAGSTYWGAQKILSDGKKLFFTGQKTSGCFFVIPGDETKVFICEGYATGFSIHKATGNKVLCAMSLKNLGNVIKYAKEVFKKSEIILCGDNDQFTDGNPGKTECAKLSSEYKIKHILPEFEDVTSKPTDFNDFERLYGSEKLLELIDGTKPLLKDEVYSQDCEEYDGYKHIFQRSFPSAKKCIISGNVYYLEKTVGTAFGKKIETSSLRKLANLSSIIPSIVSDYGLKKEGAIAHFKRFISELPRSFLIDIGKWDGVDRIEKIFEHVKSEHFTSLELSEIFKNWIASAFRRAFNPSNQNQCLILRGDQGIGKDTLIESFIECFDVYYNRVNFHTDGKDNYQNMEGSIFAHIGEQDSMHGSKLSFLKDLITGKSVTFRKSYAADSDKYMQTWSLISSSNFDDMLKDPSGNRRFLIVPIESINFAYNTYVDKNQIMAQMVHLYNTGYVWTNETRVKVDSVRREFEPEDKNQLALEQILWNIYQYEVSPPKEDRDLFRSKPGTCTGVVKLSRYTDLMNKTMKLSSSQKNAVYIALKKQGFTTKKEGYSAEIDLDKVREVFEKKVITNNSANETSKIEMGNQVQKHLI